MIYIVLHLYLRSELISIILISAATSANYYGISSYETDNILINFYGDYVFRLSYLTIKTELDNLELLLPVYSSLPFYYFTKSIVTLYLVAYCFFFSLYFFLIN